ncbi:MAG TPA: toxin-antitoxin system HicB family antitoxin [Thiotrichaceae bacterium]|nr:toxin-antitoxin system HicB family antitoxin [Thiotrichaceae bacterium]
MNNSQVITTITMPMELQQRLEQQAKHQGISMNQLINYLLTIQLTQLEMINSLESKLSQKSLPELKTKVSAILEGIPSRYSTYWDLR